MPVVTPDLPEIFEEAFDRAGLQMRTAYDIKTARRSLPRQESFSWWI